MRIAKSLMIVFVAAFVLMATDSIAEDTVYRWVDENGVVHFGDRPVDAANADKVEIRPSQPSYTQPASDTEGDAIYEPPGPSVAQQQREERAKNRQEAAEKAKVLAAKCDQNRRMVAQLEPTSRILIKGEDGKVYRMDDNDRLKALNEAKAFIAKNCGKN